MSRQSSVKTTYKPAQTLTKQSSDFTPLMQAVISCYNGNIKETAALANVNYGYARQILTRPDVKQAIAERRTKEFNSKIASRQEIQEFWTETLRDKTKPLLDRCKCSELLAKSEGMFIERIQVEHIDLSEIEQYRLEQVKEIASILVEKQRFALSEEEQPAQFESEQAAVE